MFTWRIKPKRGVMRYILSAAAGIALAVAAITFPSGARAQGIDLAHVVCDAYGRCWEQPDPGGDIGGVIGGLIGGGGHYHDDYDHHDWHHHHDDWHHHHEDWHHHHWHDGDDD